MGTFRSEPQTTKHTVCENHQNLQFGVSSMCGWRQYMEDSHITKYDEHVSIFGVFDGHGGPECAIFASRHFVQIIQKNKSFIVQEYEKALTETFCQIDQMMQSKQGKTQLKKIRDENAQRQNAQIYEGDTLSGCTANVCLITKTHIYCANVGDSRSVAALRDPKTQKMKAKDLSFDHKPENAKEKDRIFKAGGSINKEGRINQNLNLSRALGDFKYKNNPELSNSEQMVSSFPEIISCDRKGVNFVIMGCDGIWQKKSNTQMVQWIDKNIKDEKCGRNCKKLLQKLLDQEMGKNADQEFGMDNMTAILIFV